MTVAVVAGGSGLVGGHLLNLLATSARYQSVTALVRKPITVPPGVKAAVVDFERLHGALTGLEGADVFCCLGTTLAKAGSPEAFRKVDFGCVVALATEAARVNARQWLGVSSVGANAASSALYLRVKGEAEAAVSASGIPRVVFLRPSFLVGQREEARRREALGISLFSMAAPLMLGPLRKYRPIQALDVAKALLMCAERGGAGVTVMDSDAIQELVEHAGS